MAETFDDTLKSIYNDLTDGRSANFQGQLEDLLKHPIFLRELTGAGQLNCFLLGGDPPEPPTFLQQQAENQTEVAEQATSGGIAKVNARHAAEPKRKKRKDDDDAKVIFPPVSSAAFHYTSGCLGRWFRVLLLPAGNDASADALGLSPLELYQHERMYDEISRDLNIPIWPKLLKSLVVQLGGDDKRAIAGTSYTYIHIPKDTTDRLKDYFNKHQAKRFYRLVMGYSKWETEENTILRPILHELNQAVDQLCAIRGNDGNQTHEEQREHVFLAFCFSFFLSIRNRRVNGSNPAYILAVPLHEGKALSPGVVHDYMYVSGAFVGSYSILPTDNLVEYVKSIASRIVRVLGAMEAKVMREGQRHDGLSIHEEDVLRKCAAIEDRAQETSNLYSSELAKLLGFDHATFKARTTDEFKELHEMTGADHKMMRILHKINLYAKACYDEKETDIKKKLKPGQTLFLHSEPGCGKEILASLYSMLGPRYVQSTKIGWNGPITARNMLSDNIEELKRFQVLNESLLDIYEFPNTVINKQIEYDKLSPAERATSHSAHLHEIDQLFLQSMRHNYEAVNAGVITTEAFDELLIGGRKKPGVLIKQHYLCGTVFLDEINTIDFKVANKLLRILAKPYQVTLKSEGGNYESLPVNLQIVFGSNRSPEQLIADGLNSAVVFRIAENSIRIPPLRERKADIALFVNKYILKRKTDGGEHACLKKIMRISLDGLRLICELPWPDNYRGLKGLLNDILEDREMRLVVDPEITFDDVIRAVSRREAMGRASIPQKALRLVLTQE